MIEGQITAHDSGVIIFQPDLARGSDVLEFRVEDKAYLLTQDEYRAFDREVNEDSYRGGYEEGYEEGKREADDGQEAYNEGHDEGFNEGHTEGHAEGFAGGRKAGFDEGYDDGWKSALDAVREGTVKVEMES